MSGAMSEVVQEVRDRVRTGGISPNAETAQLRHIVEDILAQNTVVPDHALDTEPLLPVAELLMRQISGYGPLQPLLDDPDIEEIWINEPDRIFVARNGKSELTNVIINEQDVRALVERMLASSGRRVDLSNPFVDA